MRALKTLLILNLLFSNHLQAAVLKSRTDLPSSASATSAPTAQASPFPRQAAPAQPSATDSQGMTTITVHGQQIQVPQAYLAQLTPAQQEQFLQQAEKLSPQQIAQLTTQALTSTQSAQHSLPLEMTTLEIGDSKIIVPKAFLAQLTPQQRQEFINQAPSMSPEQINQVTRRFLASQPAQSESERRSQIRSTEQLKREQAFNMLLDDVLPLSPDQIVRLRKGYDQTLQAKATPPHAPPTPQIITKTVQLSPGSEIPVIRLAAGFVTSLLFVDATGACWPITAYNIGDPESFRINWNQKDNTLFIQSGKDYAHGNLAVRLCGLDTPIMITLVSGQHNVDFRVNMQVGERGPQAKPPVIDTTFEANVNPLLLNILDGIPPRGSIKLNVIGGPGDAWLADNKIYFRSKLTLLSPAWVATVSSLDGMHVYELMLTPYLVASQNGKTIDIKLTGL